MSEQQWKNYCKHIEKVEENMWEADSLQDDIDPFIIQLTGLSSGSDDEVSSTSLSLIHISIRNISEHNYFYMYGFLKS